MAYLVTTPWWLRAAYKNLIWEVQDSDEPSVYLTFDDGPHQSITPFVLDVLKEHNAKATFFCIGKNVEEHPLIYERILAEGHTTGNHTHNHLNGWKTLNEDYISNINKASTYISSKLFRPPYGRIKQKQATLLQNENGYNVYMWSVLSADFDRSISPEQCLKNVTKNIRPGSIVVFHDSEKAWDRMKYALPKVLEYCNKQHWNIKALPK